MGIFMSCFFARISDKLITEREVIMRGKETARIREWIQSYQTASPETQELIERSMECLTDVQHIAIWQVDVLKRPVAVVADEELTEEVHIVQREQAGMRRIKNYAHKTDGPVRDAILSLSNE